MGQHHAKRVQPKPPLPRSALSDFVDQVFDHVTTAENFFARVKELRAQQDEERVGYSADGRHVTIRMRRELFDRIVALGLGFRLQNPLKIIEQIVVVAETAKRR